jgi:hypothetical protein
MDQSMAALMPMLSPVSSSAQVPPPPQQVMVNTNSALAITSGLFEAKSYSNIVGTRFTATRMGTRTSHGSIGRRKEEEATTMDAEGEAAEYRERNSFLPAAKRKAEA